MNKLSLFTGVALLAITGATSAASIGNWSGSSRSWNNESMTSIKTVMTNEGHIVNPDSEIGGMDAYDLFIIGEPTVTPTSAELSELSGWVSSGGTLLLFGDSDGSGLPALSNISTGLGLSLNWGGIVTSRPTLQGGSFATEGTFNIVGETLSTTRGQSVTGGNIVATDYINWLPLGAGEIFAFGDRSDHNLFITAYNSSVNNQLFTNIVNGPTTVPVPPAAWLFATGLLAVFGAKKRAAASLG